LLKSDEAAPRAPASGQPRAQVIERVIAYLIDLVPVAMLESASLLTVIPLLLPLAPVLPAIATIYFLLRDSIFDGQSVGKRLLGLRVVDVKTSQPGARRESILRNFPLALAFFLPIVPVIGHLLGAGTALFVFSMEAIAIFTDRDGRRLGDKFAGTIVVRDPRSRR
jgi:uncharacterized RDD family membrane protein YckC